MPNSSSDYSLSPLRGFTPRVKFVLAIIPGLVILGLTPLLPPILYKTPAVFLYAAVLLSAWLGGVVVGGFSLAICVLISLFFLRPHILVNPNSDLPSFIRLFIFLTTNIFFLIMLDRLEKALKQSRNALAVRDNFISSASHELKTPLTSMTLQLDVAKLRFQDNKDEELNNFLGKLKKQSSRLDQLISGMIDVTLIDSSQFLLIKNECEFSEIVNNVVDYFKEKNIPITFTTHSKAFGHWDARRLEQVAYCLIQNAVKCGSDKEVQVEVFNQDKNCILTVSDSGEGLTKKEITHLFNRFPATTTKYHETGMSPGLYLSQRIVEKHGGNISVTSIPEKKTVFKVFLPHSHSG